MPKMVQIRHVPDALHRRLRIRAAHEGQSLSDYLLRQLAVMAETPTPKEMLERLRLRTPVDGYSSAALIREERDRR